MKTITVPITITIPDTAKYDAGALLDKMRPGIEDLLQILAREFAGMPTCPSQSHRAKRALDILRADFYNAKAAIKSLPPGPSSLRSALFERTSTFFRRQQRLEDFLAVHRTIELLERPSV